jgi:hypothetical protein
LPATIIDCDPVGGYASAVNSDDPPALATVLSWVLFVLLLKPVPLLSASCCVVYSISALIVYLPEFNESFGATFAVRPARYYPASCRFRENQQKMKFASSPEVVLIARWRFCHVLHYLFTDQNTALLATQAEERPRICRHRRTTADIRNPSAAHYPGAATPDPRAQCAACERFWLLSRLYRSPVFDPGQFAV